MEYKQDDSGVFSLVFNLESGRAIVDNSAIISMYFIEDIFSFSITGKLIINDMQGLIEFGPITGNETVTIIYGKDENIEITFLIYKIGKITPLDKMSQIEIILVDPFFVPLTQTKYSRSWKNTKISNIVKEISKNMLEIDNFHQFEDSNEIIDCFYIPYWTPLKTLTWLMKRCTGASSNQAGYLYFNSNKGTNFITLDNLLSKKVSDSNNYVLTDTSEYYNNKILSRTLNGIDRMSMKKIKGAHKLGYDFETKSFLDEEYTYKDSVKNLTILGRKTLFRDISDSNIRFDMEAESDQTFLDNIYNSEFNKKYSLQQTISVIVRGDEKRAAGDIIEIEWLSTSPDEIVNKLMIGKYLIKSITHQFSRNQMPWIQKLVLIKNGYQDVDISELIKASKTNV